MRAIIQRVTRASVTVNGGRAPRHRARPCHSAGRAGHGRYCHCAQSWPKKCAHLRIFEDENGKLNRSAVELGYSALVVSNFTLYGDTAKGQTPQLYPRRQGRVGCAVL